MQTCILFLLLSMPIAGHKIPEYLTDKQVVEYKNKAELGDAKAAFDLSTYYIDYKEDYERYVFWTKVSAINGNEIAQHSLGMYFLKKGNKKDAYYWLKKAAENGNTRSQSMIEYWLDDDQIKQHKRMAESGDGDSALVLFKYYKNAVIDLKEASRWLHMAAEKGNKEAIDILKAKSKK